MSIARLAGSFVVGVGGLVLVGWVLDVPFLKGSLHGLVEMKADTAVGFLAMGSALLLAISEPSAGRRRATRVLASLTILIGALTLAEYLLGRNLGLDELLFRDVHAVHTANRGRLAPQTAIIFVALGFALLFPSTVGAAKSRFVGAATGTSFVIVLFAVIGYAYGASPLAGAPRWLIPYQWV